MVAKKHRNELRKYVLDDTKTISILDEFEGIGEKNDTIYDRLVLNNTHYLYLNNERYSCHLVIERSKSHDYVGDITFTKYKKGEGYQLSEYIGAEVTAEVAKKYKGTKEIFYFSKPFHLRAQNSLNRTGYGWEWDWSDGVGSYIEGTEYGETTDYVFCGGLH